MQDPPSKAAALAASLASVAQATGVGGLGVEPFTMLLNTAPQLVFGIAVYYMLIRSQEKQSRETEASNAKFQQTIETISARSERVADNFVSEFRLQAQEDRAQHSQLYQELAKLAREQMAINASSKDEVLVLRAQVTRILEDDRRRSAPAANAEFQPAGRGRNEDDPGIPAPKPR